MKKSYTLHSDNLFYTEKSLPVKPLNNNINEDQLLPGKHIIQNLINYSKSLSIIKFQSIGTFGFISN
ncbi:MAG: hypothetical protein ACOYO1_10440 [Bacteroidales bacterium]